MKKILLLSALILTCFIPKTWAQGKIDSTKTIQFSGVVITDEEGEMIPLPYTNIGIEGTSRGTSSDRYGFFSIAARIGETVRFSRIGFKDVDFTIPDTLNGTLYSVFQIMTEDTLLLPETVIYPWPSKEHFEIEFLAMEIDNDLQKIAEDNLSKQIRQELVREMPLDGRESTKYTITNQAAAFKYDGQYKPQNIFSPLAWKKFFDAWKRGDFKNKKKKN